MNVYFELAECMVGGEAIGYPGRYFATYGAKGDLPIPARYHGMAAGSDRIWCENDNGEVRFAKHRYQNVSEAPVDMKEFFWIKLKCQTV